MLSASQSPVGTMASLGLLLLSSALILSTQSLPAARGGGRGLDVSVGGVRRQRRDVHELLSPYEEQMMPYAAVRGGGGGANDLYYQPDSWRGRGLDQALQRLVERDQWREQEEEQRTAYLAALLRLLNEAESGRLVPGAEVELLEEDDNQLEEDEDAGPAPPDYDETGAGLVMGRPRPAAATTAAWWGLLEPPLAQALLQRMEPQVARALLERARQSRPDEEALRHLVARLLSSMGPDDGAAAVPSSGRRARRELMPGAAAQMAASAPHRRTRRSLDQLAPPSPSNNPPLLRVKRLEEEEEEEEEEERKLRPPTAAVALQRMKRIDTEEELNHGSHRRRRRAAITYDPQVLIHHIVQYLRE